MKKKVFIKNYSFILFFIIMIINCLFSDLIAFSYIDEIICLFCLCYIIKSTITRQKRIKTIDLIFILFIVIGLIGNLIYINPNTTLIDIFLDLFMFLKPYLLFEATYVFIITNNENNIIINSLKLISKYALIGIFLCSIIYFLFGYMSDDSGFAFFTGYRGELAMCTFALLGISFFGDDRKLNINKLFYYIISLIIILLTDSGLGILGLLLFGYLMIVFNNKKINYLYTLVLLILCILLGNNEIKSYLLNSNAPRNIMMICSLKNAIVFFPFGSGFGSFGGYIAAHKYSQLYFYYGINNLWLMGPNDVNGPKFLFDSYYPQIIGQFGIIGVFLYLIIIIYLLNRTFREKNHLSLSILLFLLAMGLGFNVGGIAGCILFFTLAISLALTKRKEVNKDSGSLKSINSSKIL